MPVTISKVSDIVVKTSGKTASQTRTTPIILHSDDQGLISWSMLGNGQQQGTPSPDNIIMPDFCGVRTGNLVLVSADNDIVYSNYTNYTVENGRITNTGRTLVGFAAKVSPQTEYTVSAYSTAGNLRIREYSQKPSSWSGNFVVQSVNTLATYGQKEATFTTQAETTWVLVCWYTEVKNAVMYSIMLNLGSTAFPYEPYGWKIPITCAGQTTPVYLGQTQTVRRIKKLVLTGEEDWMLAPAGVNEYAYLFLQIGDYNSVVVNQNVCGHFPATTISIGNNNQGFACQNKSAPRSACAIFRYDGYTDTTDAWKAYLAQQYAAGTPVTVWYVLATPETAIVNEPLVKIGDYADELRSTDAAVTIPTANGENTLSTVGDLPSSSMTITYNSPDYSKCVRAVDAQGKPMFGVHFGFKIDKSKTDSDQAIIYTHDAVTMTPAYMDFTNGVFNYGSWANVWFVKEAKPVALNLDGTIAYYLDPDDYTKKIDGTNSDIFYTLLTTEPSDWSTQWKQYYHLNNGKYVLNDDAEAPTFTTNSYYTLETSFTGNFMVQFPKVYFKRYEDANYNYVEVSDRKLSSDFKAYAHLNANGDELDFIYLPMFKGVIQSSKLRSIPGVIPQGGTTASTEVTAAEACGTGWQIWDHSSREMINDLLVLMSKNADSQAKFGKGRESGYNASDTETYGKLQTGTLIRKGAFYGYNTSYSDVKVFHIEGFWANRFERLQGLLLVDGVYKIKMTPPYNLTGTDFITLSTPSPTSNNYVRTLATSEYGSVTATVSAYASAPFKDYFYQNQSGTRVGLVGGYCYSGSHCGPRCVSLGNGASNTNWNIGASPIFRIAFILASIIPHHLVKMNSSGGTA